jgi:hypothetical protein
MFVTPFGVGGGWRGDGLSTLECLSSLQALGLRLLLENDDLCAIVTQTKTKAGSRRLGFSGFFWSMY